MHKSGPGLKGASGNTRHGGVFIQTDLQQLDDVLKLLDGGLERRLGLDSTLLIFVQSCGGVSVALNALLLKTKGW